MAQSDQEQLDDLITANKRNADLTGELQMKIVECQNIEEERDCSRQELSDMSTSEVQKVIELKTAWAEIDRLNHKVLEGSNQLQNMMETKCVKKSQTKNHS